MSSLLLPVSKLPKRAVRSSCMIEMRSRNVLGMALAVVAGYCSGMLISRKNVAILSVQSTAGYCLLIRLVERLLG